MPAAVGTAFNWVRVSGGVWTKIASGPLVTGLPFQALELAASVPTPGRTINWTLDGYNALVPYYNRTAVDFGIPEVRQRAQLSPTSSTDASEEEAEQ